jgi:hypothetical protein
MFYPCARPTVPYLFPNPFPIFISSRLVAHMELHIDTVATDWELLIVNQLSLDNLTLLYSVYTGVAMVR